MFFPSVVPPVPGEYLVQASATSSASGDASEAAEKSMARSSISQELKLPFYSYAIKVLPDRNTLEETEKVWSHALYKWQQIFEVLGYPGQLGREILQEQVESDPNAECVALRDSLGNKIAENCVETCSDFVAVFFMAANACCGVGSMEQIALLAIPAARWTFETISFKRHDTIGGIQICKICFGN